MERNCKSIAEESLIFDGDDKFLIKMRIHIEGDTFALLGYLRTPASPVTLLEIPREVSDIEFEKLSGSEKTIQRVNKETLNPHGITEKILVQSITKRLSKSDDFKVIVGEKGINLVQAIDEGSIDYMECPKGLSVGCPNNTRRACNFIKKLEEASGASIKTTFLNLTPSF